MISQCFLLTDLINKIKAMDVSMEDDDCAVEAVTYAKKKKLKQGIFTFKFTFKIIYVLYIHICLIHYLLFQHDCRFKH